MGWQEELARQIEAMGEDDWDKEYAILESVYDSRGARPDRSLAFKMFDVEIGDFPLNGMPAFFDTVNDRETAGAPAGTLLVRGFSFPIGKAKAMVVVFRRRPWNEFAGPDGEWHKYRDASGQPPYPPADLSLIP